MASIDEGVCFEKLADLAVLFTANLTIIAWMSHCSPCRRRLGLAPQGHADSQANMGSPAMPLLRAPSGLPSVLYLQNLLL